MDLADLQSSCSCGSGDTISCVSALYHYLWKKNPQERSRFEQENIAKRRKLHRVFLPDTIVYRRHQPTQWYFTAKSTGAIKKKKKVNISPQSIIDNFQPLEAELQTIIAIFIGSSHLAPSDDTKTIYITKQELPEFLRQNHNFCDGILQSHYVVGTIFRVVTSSQSGLVTALAHISNNSIQRFTHSEETRSDDQTLCDAPNIIHEYNDIHDSATAERFVYTSRKISHHIDVSFPDHKLTYLDVLYKLDAEDQIWFLFAYSAYISPSTIWQQASYSPVVRQQKDFICVQCDKIVAKSVQLPENMSVSRRDSDSDPVFPSTKDTQLSPVSEFRDSVAKKHHSSTAWKSQTENRSRYKKVKSKKVQTNTLSFTKDKHKSTPHQNAKKSRVGKEINDQMTSHMNDVRISAQRTGISTISKMLIQSKQPTSTEQYIGVRPDNPTPRRSQETEVARENNVRTSTIIPSNNTTAKTYGNDPIAPKKPVLVSVGVIEDDDTIPDLELKASKMSLSRRYKSAQ